MADAPGGEQVPAGDLGDPAAERVIAQLLADPQLMSRRLSEDLAAVSALGRGGATVDPELPASELVAAVRAQADRLTFSSPVEAATAAMRHGNELPLGECEPQSLIGPYHVSASVTVADGELVREQITEDAGIELVFHRRAGEPNRTSVLLEAVVHVDASGSLFLTSYGWPTRVMAGPVLGFEGPADGYLRQLLSDLTAAGETPESFPRAMVMAYGFAVATARDGMLPADVLEAAQPQVLWLVTSHVPSLAGYLDDAVNLAERGGLNGWLAACTRRSAAEALFAGFLGSATFELIDADVLGELEEAIADAARELPASTRQGLVPAGTPAGHEWWLVDAGS